MVEAMVAIFIIIVGITAILQMFPLSVQQQKLGERATVAASLGQGKIEEITAKSYNDIAVGLTTEDYGSISGFNLFKRTTEINCVNSSDQEVDCDYNPTNDPQPLKKIEVTVYWKSSWGTIEKNIKIATLFAKR